MTTSRGRPRQGAFISYARADGESAARTLHARLQADAPDVRAWLDRYEIEGGVGWWNQIEEALDRAEFLLLVMTPAAMHSENTRREWRSARQRGVCVYPIKGAADDALDFSALPNWMRKAHFYDRNLLVWDLESGERIAAFTADAALRSLAVSPAGNVVAAGDVSGRVHFLRLAGAPGSR